jgi:hypothetical protein
MPVVGLVTLFSATLALMGWAPSAYAADTTSTVTTLASPSVVLGGSETATATVAGDATFGSPTESVSFYECGPTPTPTPCTSTADPVGSAVNLAANEDGVSSAASSSPFTPTSTGYWCFASDYSGDSNYASSDDNTTDGCFDVTASTTTVSAPTSSNIVLGTSDSDIATVTGNATNGSPTESVSFYECGPTPTPTPCASTAHPVGSAVNLAPNGDGVSSAASSSPFTPTSTGYWCFTASYQGDPNYAASSDNAATDGCVDVTVASTTTTGKASATSIALGASIHDGATVAGNAAGGSPTGSVTFYACGPQLVAAGCTSSATQVGKAAVNLTAGLSATATATSVAFTPNALGIWCFGASYTGDTNYTGSSDTSTDQCVNVTQASSTTTTVPANTTVTLGEAVTDSAIVAGNAAGLSPTGTVSFYECGPTSAAAACTSTTSPLGSPVNLTPGASATSSATSIPFTPSSVGYWCFGAVYSGSVNYKVSSDTLSKECVDVLGSLTIVTTTVPHAVLNSDYTESMVARGGTAPYTWSHTGTLPHGVAFSTSGAFSGVPTVSGSFPLTIKVADSSHLRQYAAEDLTLIVNVHEFSTITASKPVATTIVLGGTAGDTTKVTGTTTGGVPTGTVSYTECGPTAVPTACTATSHALGSPVTVTAGTHNSATAASALITPTSTGYWCFGSVYSGNLNYKLSTDNVTSECVDVTVAPSSTATTPTNTSIVLGTSNSASATVTGLNVAGSPTGTVTFYECGESSVPVACTSTAEPVGTAVTLTSAGKRSATAASLSFVPTSTGTWCFGSSYSGDADYAGSTDITSDGCFTVAPSPTTTSTGLANTTITLGQNDNDAATVTGNVAGGSPTGAVAFYQCGPESAPAKCTSKTHKVGGTINVTAGAGDTASASSAIFKPTAVGYWCFAAYYLGDANYAASTSAVLSECVLVNGPPSIITTSLPKGKKGVAYTTTTLVGRGGTLPYTWSHTGTLPFGMGLSSAGVLSGTPNDSGSFTVTIKLTDASNPRITAERVLTLVIAA